ncbi:hypothetical protein FAI40_03205 [Acetobacteraceae bacterium]|nr:hypothetical protein FAI40_03205 [Acetobacteraceae bacterium]
MRNLPKHGRVSGSQANFTGKKLEGFVSNVLIDYGYENKGKDQKKSIFQRRSTFRGKSFYREIYCGSSIYGTDRRCDFLVINKDLFPNDLIIECKWQSKAGSVDEKYPFAVENIKNIGVPTIILIDGDGYKKGAFSWLKEQVNRDNNSLIGVYTMKEFMIATSAESLLG